MKKFIALFSLCVFTLTGCSSTTTTKSYTYDVETGDSIKVTLETSDGYDISSDVPFVISKDDEELSSGTFITEAYIILYLNEVQNDEDATIIDKGENDEISYTFYSYNDEEFNYIIEIKDSDTGVLLGNPNSQKEAEEVFERLNFEIDD